MNIRSSLVRRVLVATLGVVGTASVALADNPYWAKGRHNDNRGYRESEYARVLDVEPIVRRVRVSTPERSCWNETQEVYPSRPSSTGGAMVLGGLIGGVLGHQIGHGDRRVGTIAGSVIGAAIGHDVGERKAAQRNANVVPVERTVERCNVSYREEFEERIDGYRVTYVYNGREYATRMPYDPGKRIRVNVNIQPEYERPY